jgi:hypothetical protein
MTGTINPALFGMPDATTTGPQAGVTLTPYTGPTTITTPGAVIQNVIINGELTVDAANVTIRNCIIQTNDWWGVNGDQATNLTVENCKIIGGNLTNSGILGSGTFVGNDISNVGIGIQLTDGASTVSGNYVHDLFYGNGAPHYDGVVALGGQNHVVIENNTIWAPDENGTAAVFIDNDFGSVNDVVVKNNLMFGDPAYTVHVDQKTGQTGTITNVVIQNNYLERGYYGYISVDNTNATILNNVQWNNNTDPTPYPSSVPSSPSTPSSPTPPSTPTIASFSNDTGKAGDGITNDNTPTLSGTAVANSTVKVFDGTTQVGSTTASGSGQWSLTTTVLSDGTHNLTATDTDLSGNTSASSTTYSVTIDTHAPAAPVLVGDPLVNTNHVQLSGTAEANSTITVYDGTAVVGTGTTSSTGTWSVTTSALPGGGQALTASATDVAGNVSAMSHALDPVIPSAAPAPSPTTPSAVNFTSLTENSSHIVTIKGTADAFSQVKLYDGTTSLGTVTTGSTGAWTYTTSSAVSDKLHTYTAQEVNTGHVVATSSGAAILAASNTSTMTGTGGNDFFYSSSSHLSDTFVFSSHFGNSTIQGFSAGSGSGHDVVQFSKSVFDSFATVLSHASQVGQDVVISSGSETLKLLNTKLSALNSQDFHFA